MTDHELLQALYNDMQDMKCDIQTLKADNQSMKNDIQTLKTDMQTMKTDMQTVKQKVIDMELHIENVTDKNIRITAEGHLNLDRKLDEALKVENEKEMLIIRVHVLEDELRKVKGRLA